MSTTAMGGPSLNPWLSAYPSAPDVEEPELTGPAAPQPRTVTPPDPTALPRQVRTAAAQWWWVGAHGGAGESALAAAVPTTAASDHTWPQPCPDIGGRHPVVLVARTHASGLLAAQRALTQWAAGDAGNVELLGLALLADAPDRLPHALRDLARLVAGGSPRTWHLPWMEGWRLGGADLRLRAGQTSSTPAALRRLCTQARHLTAC